MVRTRKITLPSWHSSAQLAHLRVSLSEIEYLRSTMGHDEATSDGFGDFLTVAQSPSYVCSTLELVAGEAILLMLQGLELETGSSSIENTAITGAKKLSAIV
jgi:hypothetical protein